MTLQDKKRKQSRELISQYGKGDLYTIQQLSKNEQIGLYNMIKGTCEQIKEKINVRNDFV